jgi:hypothetical protein
MDDRLNPGLEKADQAVGSAELVRHREFERSNLSAPASERRDTSRYIARYEPHCEPNLLAGASWSLSSAGGRAPRPAGPVDGTSNTFATH